MSAQAVSNGTTYNLLRRMGHHNLASNFAKALVVLGEPDPTVVAELEAMNEITAHPLTPAEWALVLGDSTEISDGDADKVLRRMHDWDES